MKLTTEIVQRYVGGQLEIQNMSEHYVYRGEIETAEVVGVDPTDSTSGALKIRFKWLAKMGEGGWHAQENLDYNASMILLHASDIGQGRIHYSLTFSGESATFFPPGGSKLDPARVIGLELAS